MKLKLSELQRECLQWYANREQMLSQHGRDLPPIHRWSNRQINWAVERGLLSVGPNGWRAITHKGREALDGTPAPTSE